MDFGALPPEVNSAKMYSGSGSGSMLAAATAWDAVADGMYFAAGRCAAVISPLASEAWLGPASSSMVAATAPYLAWLNTTAAQAQQTAAQARAAASAYEAAFSAMVPPPVIAANRLLLASLTATNFLGINTPAIATTEADYSEMWAQDAAAMYGYASASAVASTLTQFTPPAEMADSTTLASQVPQGVQQLAQSLRSTISTSGSSLTQAASDLSSLSSPASSCASTLSSSVSATSSLSSVVKTLTPSATLTTPLGDTEVLGSAFKDAFNSGLGALRPVSSAGLGVPASAVSAEFRRAMPIGQLSVPQTWVAPSRATLTPGSLAGANPGGSGVHGTSGFGNMFSGLPIAGMTPREVGPGGAVPRAGFRPTVMPRERIGG